MNAVTGRHVIPAGLTAEVIERLPGSADFMRVVKVKVTSPNMKAKALSCRDRPLR
jgi:hypothetical protein